MDSGVNKKFDGLRQENETPERRDENLNEIKTKALKFV